MDHSDLLRTVPRLESVERMKEVHPQERRRQQPAADAAEKAQGRVPLDAAPTADRLTIAVQQANAVLAASPVSDRQVRFTVDAQTNQVVVQVVDKDTSEVVRQIPGEAALRNLRNLESIRGMLFDKKL